MSMKQPNSMSNHTHGERVRFGRWRRGLQLSLVIACCGISIPQAFGQDEVEEPPRIFRGGIVRQLRSLTEGAIAPKTDAASKETKKSAVPQPPALEPPERMSDDELPPSAQSPMEARTANMRSNNNQGASNNGSRTNQRSTTNSRTKSANENNGRPVSSKPAAPKSAVSQNRDTRTNGEEASRRNAELGVPVTNSKLAEEARFKLSDGPESGKTSQSRGYNANSKYDSGEEPTLPKVPSEKPQVQAVEKVESAPKVNRKPLPPSPVTSQSKSEASKKNEVKSQPKSARPETTFESDAKPTARPESKLPNIPSIENESGNSTSNLPADGRETPAPTVPSLPSLPNSSLPPASSLLQNEVGAPARREGVDNSNPIRGANGVASDERMSMETPRLQVLLKGPKDLPIDTPSEYQIVVRNADNIPLDGVILRLEIPKGIGIQAGKPSLGELQSEQAPDGATLVAWTFTDLAAYQNAEAPITITAAQPKNFALAMEWTLLPKTGETRIDVRQAQLELAMEGPSEAEFGVVNMYHLHVRNLGSAPAKAVKVKLEASAFGASEVEVGDIKPGEQQTVNVELTFNERGNINILATATSSNQKSESKIDVMVKRPMIDVALAGTEQVIYGASASYELRIHNSGDMDARELVGRLTLPEGAELVSKPDNVRIEANELVWELPTLKTGQTFAIPVDMKLARAGDNAFTFSCTGKNIENKTASCSTRVDAVADLKLVVNDPVAPAPVEGVATYELTITNRGSQAASNVRALAQFSEGIEPIGAEGAQHKVLTGQVVFEPIAQILPGESKVLRIQAKAGAAGVHRFRAEVRSDDSALRLVQEETTQYLSTETRLASPAGNKVIR